MAVVAVWQCDRDGKMFENKKDAEEYDKMLELAENISALIAANVKGLDAENLEAVGLLLAKHREPLAKACKGKPEVLTELCEDQQSAAPADSKEADSESSKSSSQQKLSSVG